MKQILLIVFGFVLAMPTLAENLVVLTPESEFYNPIAISPNGKYISGTADSRHFVINLDYPTQFFEIGGGSWGGVGNVNDYGHAICLGSENNENGDNRYGQGIGIPAFTEDGYPYLKVEVFKDYYSERYQDLW
ncbi:MAG: hypothetical protein LIP09_08160 [Bacteroidales bacterium]|nr:hypothetical protein [Bacteroidales bacterium]